MTNRHDHNPELPDDLRGFERSLDALGERVRAAAPDAIGERVIAATTEMITAPRDGGLRLSGADADPIDRFTLNHHWRLAASVALLVVAVVAAITLQQPPPVDERFAGADPDAVTEEWIEFEITYASDTVFENDALESLDSELDALELSFQATWTLDETLDLSSGESL